MQFPEKIPGALRTPPHICDGYQVVGKACQKHFAASPGDSIRDLRIPRADDTVCEILIFLRSYFNIGKDFADGTLDKQVRFLIADFRSVHNYEMVAAKIVN